MIPGNNGFSNAPQGAAFLPPDDRKRNDLKRDYELGGVSIGNGTQGLSKKIWLLWTEGDNVVCGPEDGSSPSSILFSAPSITEVSLAFDQSMRPHVGYVSGGVCYFRYWDSNTNAYAVLTLTSCSSPMVCLDDRRRSQFANNDVMVFYIKDSSVYFRQQRDQYATERLVGALPPRTIRISQVGMNVKNRLQLTFLQTRS